MIVCLDSNIVMYLIETDPTCDGTKNPPVA